MLYSFYITIIIALLLKPFFSFKYNIIFFKNITEGVLDPNLLFALFLHSVIFIHTGSVLKIANQSTLAGSSFNLPIQLHAKASFIIPIFYMHNSWH